MPASTPHIVIIGGGISGLAAAHHLQKKARAADTPLSYTLLEKSPRLGGKIVTRQVGELLIEGGPDCFLTRKPAALNLCRELGLADDLIATNEGKRRVFVLNHGRLHPLPEGVMLIVPTKFMPFALSPLISIPGKLRMGLDLFIPRRQQDDDETLASFVRRRLGNEALAKIAEPLLSGIHVSDPERLSLKSSFPRLLETERKYGSLIKGMLAAKRMVARQKSSSQASRPMFMSLRGGMQQLVDTLCGQLDSERIQPGRAAVAIHSLNGGGPPYQVETQDGRTVQADALVLATPSDVAANLLEPIDQALARDLASIRYVSTAVVSFGFRATRSLDGFGFIIPKTERRRITACTWSSTKFNHRAPDGYQLLRCFVGGPGREEMAEQSDSALVQLVREELAAIMDLQAMPDQVSISRWYKANPQYDLNHLEHVEKIRAAAGAHPGLTLAGSAYDGVGVPDCIRQGQQAAEVALAAINGQ